MTYKRILIVDDDPDLLFLLSHGVKQLNPNYHVSTAIDGDTALNQIRKRKFDLLITDYMMPGMSGLDLLQTVRRISPETQIVLMTAHHDSNGLRDTVESLALGGFVGKPFSLPEILQLVERVVARTNEVANATPIETPGPREIAAGPLRMLWRKTGAHFVVLLNSDGYPLYVVGETNRAKVSRLAAFVAANFLAVTELATLLGDNSSIFKSSYHEGSNYNIYAHGVNKELLVAVVFGTEGKPGTVWFYTKQAATVLASLLSSTSETAPFPAVNSTTASTEFDDLLSD